MAKNSIPNGICVRNDDATTDSHYQPMPDSTPIAIVGMACRFAGNVNSPSDLWKLCIEGKDAWSPIPAERFDSKSWYDPESQKQGKTNVLGGYFLQEDISLFDAAFFNYPGDLANAMDPQMRLLLESTYESMEDAGIPMEKLAGSNASVFTATFSKDYYEIQVKDPDYYSKNFTGGVGLATLSNRISHFFDLQGPSMTIDTGCSGSLVALHQACQSIRSGESDISIVGGANSLLHQDPFIYIGLSGTLGPNGRCYAWDSRAEGYGRGEGVATLILKPLSAALRDRDRIHAVIRESALNQDGKTTTLYSPSVDAQTKLIEDCYRRAGLDISDTGYVEAHMTGTPTGDPIEAEALARTFGASHGIGDTVLVGSVKTNVGHTESVSGLAAVIKTSFALQEGLIPPNMNYHTTNPKIPLERWHVEVPRALTKWPRDRRFRASVNNFGYGGSNAHVILERGPAGHARPSAETNGIKQESDRSHVFILSAKDAGVVKQMVTQFTTHIRDRIGSGQSISSGNLAYTLAKRRSVLPWRVVIRAENLDELCTKLESPANQAIHSTKVPRLGFVFNGQGAQWHAMARELIDWYPVFGQAIRNAGKIIKEYGAPWSLLDELMRDESSTRVSEVHLSQPVTVAIQLCLVDLLRSWNITPTAVTSHSSGEIAAAYAVEAISFREALGLAYFRGDLALKHQKLSARQGGMLAVGLSCASAESYIAGVTAGQVMVACINSPHSVTLSGDVEALKEIASRLAQNDVFHRRLKVPMAYHSHHMSSIAQDYTRKLEDILPPRKRWNGALFASPTTGELVNSVEALSPKHWTRNLTSPVLFSQAFEKMCFGPKGSQVDIIVEIGAHGTLAGSVRDIHKARQVQMPYFSCLTRHKDSVRTMQDLVCNLMGRGYPVDLEPANFPHSGYRDGLAFVPDLPTYPWNHTTRYWCEPRISEELRHRKYPPQELLGSPVAGANGVTPTWRNFLRLSDVEWLVDHKVGSRVVLPGSAYISMAIEALRCISDLSEDAIRGYRLRDIDILSALVVPETSQGIETQLLLRQASGKDLEHNGWYEFEVCSLGSSGMWVSHCKGFVSAETKEQAEKEMTYERQPPSEECYFGNDPDISTSEISVGTIFSTLREMGIEHGPTFQNLTASRAAGDRAITNIAISSVATEGQDYVLHPTTLDSIFQATYSSLPKDKSQGLMYLPRSICSLFVPCNLSRVVGDTLQAFTKLASSNRRGYVSNIAVVNSNSDHGPLPFFQIRNFFIQGIARDSADDGNSEDIGLFSRFRWEPVLLHEVPTAVRNTMIMRLDDRQAQLERDCVRASFYFIENALEKLQCQDPATWQPHHNKFCTWMKSIVQLGHRGKLFPGSQTWYRATQGMRQMLFDELSVADAACQMLVRLGQQLAPIVQGEVAPLELMMEDDLLGRFYNDFGIGKRSYRHMTEIVKSLAISVPGANVLEIGAGTGGATQQVLDAFDARANQERLPGSLLGRYTFTDISTGFFPAARQRFAAWDGMIDFQPLDIEEDPSSQSLAKGHYDIVVASMVLHATENLHKTLSNVRKMLKPGGKLLMVETTQDRLDMQLIFGTLPGWWLGEKDGREMSPNVSTSAWDKILRETGFSGLDFTMHDCDSPEIQMCSVMLSTAVAPRPIRGPISIVHSPAETPPNEWLSQLCDQIFAETDIFASVESLDQYQDHEDDRICIFVAEMEHPVVCDMTEQMFKQLRKLLVSSRDVLWLSCGGLVDADEPSFAATQGLLRTLRWEDPSKRYVHLDLETASSRRNNVWTNDKIGHIVRVLQNSFNEEIDSNTIEREYAVKDSALHVARAYPDLARHQACTANQADPKPELQPFHQPDRSLKWEASSSGLLSDMHFVESYSISHNVPSGHIEVEAKVLGLNFRDTLEALDLLNAAEVGHEAAGTVTRLGPDTEKSGFKVGDRVCAMILAPFASRSIIPYGQASKIPDDMPFQDAASIPCIFITAYQSLIPVASLQKGESVLIHAATGGVGQAAIVLAQRIGAEIFATCSTHAKRDFLVQHYGLDPDHILSSRDASFASAIMDMTNGKGVNVVLNSLSGPLLKATWDCIARFGRFIEIGKIDMEAGRNLDMTPFMRCATYASVDVLQLVKYDLSAAREALVECIRICHERRCEPVYPIAPYSISDMETAMRDMQKGIHMGKLVYIAGDSDEVKVISRSRPLSLRDKNATYLIVGGLGGIGRAIAEWMMEKGAKNMLFLSRHATTHAAANKLKVKGEKLGCVVQVCDCDIADENSLINCISDCQRTMPPIRGVINGAMVLQDSVFEGMTFQNWCGAVWPKIRGSRNLHKHLPDLSFFIMLSSATGVVGNPSQANYAAGGAFLDALARHRTRNGQPAVSLDLGVVLSAGYVAELEQAGDSSVRERVEKRGFISADIAQVIRLVEDAIRDPLRQSPDDSQVMVGVTERTTATWVRDGLALDPRFGTLQMARRSDRSLQTAGTTSNSTAALVSALSSATTTVTEATGILTDALVAKLAEIFNIPGSDIDAGLPMSRYGVDSLVAVELRKWLSSVVRAKPSVFEILQSPSISEFGALLASKSEYMASIYAMAVQADGNASKARVMDPTEQNLPL